MDLNTLNHISPAAFQSLNEEIKHYTFDHIIDVKNGEEVAKQLINYSRRFTDACILNNNYSTPHNTSGLIAAFGASKEIRLINESNAFDKLKRFFDEHTGQWIFGFFTYDLKNDVEDLASENKDSLEFPAAHYFIPEVLIYLKDNALCVKSSLDSAEEIAKSILQEHIDSYDENTVLEEDFESKPGKASYLSKVESLIHEIEQGNIYEINFCRELRAKMLLNPYSTAHSLYEHSKAPFSVFYKTQNKFLICASPERFLLKSGNELISQPIKGTRKRSRDREEDEALKKELREDVKERAENVMIVDLVRNDLSHTAEKASVKVDELFGIYTFPQVHQMISTVHSTLKSDIHFLDAIKHCFPMGSMTGAPKLRAMKLIEEKEEFKRGLFSGSVGWISPNKNFDFNVVIRSILYNSENNEVSIRTGSAITSLCSAEKEWEECQLKSNALIKALQIEK